MSHGTEICNRDRVQKMEDPSWHRGKVPPHRWVFLGTVELIWSDSPDESCAKTSSPTIYHSITDDGPEFPSRQAGVGIPNPIIDKMLKRAADSGFNAALKSDIALAGGYYWINSDCSKAPSDAVSYLGIQNGKIFNMVGSIDDAVTGVRIDDEACLVLGAELKNNVNFLATMEFKLNMSFNRPGRGAPLDVTNITYSPSYKLGEAIIADDTTACPLPLITGRKGKDRMGIKKSTVGASLLAKIAKDLKLTEDE